MLVSGFYLATDTPISAKVDGRTYQCANVLDPGSLVSGQPREDASLDESTSAERRLAARIDAACSPLERGARWVVWGGLGIGGLMLLTGWTALREREHVEETADPRSEDPAGV